MRSSTSCCWEVDLRVWTSVGSGDALKEEIFLVQSPTSHFDEEVKSLVSAWRALHLCCVTCPKEGQHAWVVPHVVSIILWTSFWVRSGWLSRQNDQNTAVEQERKRSKLRLLKKIPLVVSRCPLVEERIHPLSCCLDPTTTCGSFLLKSVTLDPDLAPDQLSGQRLSARSWGSWQPLSSSFILSFFEVFIFSIFTLAAVFLVSDSSFFFGGFCSFLFLTLSFFSFLSSDY